MSATGPCIFAGLISIPAKEAPDTSYGTEPAAECLNQDHAQ